MFDTCLWEINKALEHIKDSKKSTLSVVFKFNPMLPKLIEHLSNSYFIYLLII